MFDFLTALFGGIFYFGEISSEKAILKALEKERQEEREYHESISLTPDEDCELIRVFIENRDNTQRELLESISSELEEIYGENWRKNYPNGGSQYWNSGVREPWGIAFHILASKQHKLPYFSSMCYSLSGGLGPEKGAYVVKACEIIERNMQEKYPELRLWFKPAQKFKMSPNEPTKYEESIWLGQLIWEHIMVKPTKRIKDYPPIKRLW